MRQKRGNYNQKRNTNDSIINENIRAKEVRLIDAEGNQAGIVSTRDALKMAEEADLDLVLVSPNAEVPVAKIIDYGKAKFEQQKKAKENKQKQKHAQLKEVRVSPQIGEHDYGVKLKQARKFLANGDKVQFSLRFKGRMITHSELGREIMNRVLEDLKDEVNVDQYPKMDGRKMFLVVSPAKAKK